MSETNSVATTPCDETVVLVGLESSGKSAIFRALTGRALGDESNFRGSTVQCRHSYLSRCSLHIVDTPGIRLKGDEYTSRLALAQLRSADTVILVVRGTHAQRELSAVLSGLGGEQAPLVERAFLQRPTFRAIWWRVRATLRQFLFQAMPIFMLICVVGALCARLGITGAISATAGPLLDWVDLPRAAAPGIVFSMIRKDGLLVLNQGGGGILQQLSDEQLFLLVFVASTLTACLVTLSTIRRELGIRFAFALAGRQALTSTIAAITCSVIWRLVVKAQ
jgi:Fe2+ transport system protein B